MLSFTAGTFLIPVSCTDTGLVPGQRHVETRFVSRVTCPAVATIFADTDPEAWPLTYISAADTADSPLDLVPPPLCLPFPFFRHVTMFDNVQIFETTS